MERCPKRPSRWYYGIAILILMVGNFVAVYVFLKDFSGSQKSSLRLIVPGEHALELTEPGNYTVFYEYRSAVDGRIFSESPESLPALRCLLHTQNGIEVGLVPSLGNKRYSSFRGSAALSLFDFKIDEPGTYQLKAYYEDERQEADVVLAVARGFAEKLLYTMGIIGLILITSIGAAAYVSYKIFKKRQKFAQNLNMSKS